MRTITHGSVFSGIGAAEIAAEMLGWENVFHCEINPYGRHILNFYFPKAESYEDITKTDFTKWRDKVTVLTGGFPCQPFSYAGKRRGSEDDRYLWPFMLRCIEQVRPSWFVGENVAGIATVVFPGEDVKMGEQADLFGACDEVFEKHERYILNEITQNLEQAGYSVQPIVIPACAVGAPHRRDRIFILAHLAQDSDSVRCESGRDEELEHQKGSGDIKPDCNYGITSDTPSQRRREIYKHLQSKFSNREESFCDGREQNASDTNSRTIGNKEDSELSVSQFRKYYCNGATGFSELYSENRWRSFPTISPVCRGDDGFPFPVDCLTIPFREWRCESLKAYGNAIVPQVIYEIFKYIHDIENDKGRNKE